MTPEERDLDASRRGAEPRIVLASASPRRRDVLVQLGIQPEIQAADVDESYRAGETPREHVERLARDKAEAVARGRGDDDASPVHLVVGGDTVVVLGARILAKPADEAEAISMLRALSGRTHEVFSGLAIAHAAGIASGSVRTLVRMRSFDEATARGYVATGEPLDKAGAYGIQGKGAALVAGIEGDYYSVVGFPVDLFLELLGRVGWRFDFHSFKPMGGSG